MRRVCTRNFRSLALFQQADARIIDLFRVIAANGRRLRVLNYDAGRAGRHIRRGKAFGRGRAYPGRSLKNSTTGTSMADAMCMGPVSPPINRAQCLMRQA